MNFDRLSLVPRITLRTVIYGGAVLLASIIGTQLILRKVIIERAESQLVSLAGATAGRFAAELSSVRASVETLAVTAKLSDDSEIRTFARSMRSALERNDIARSMTLAPPEPTDGGASLTYIPSWQSNANGPEFTNLAGVSDPYRQFPWYFQTLVRRGGGWSEPYERSDQAGIKVVTYATPAGNRLPGVTGYPPVLAASVSLDRIATDLRRLVPDSQIRPYIVSQAGAFIFNGREASATGINAVTEARRLGQPQRIDLIERMLSGEAGSVSISRPAGSTSRVAFVPIPTTGWSLALELDEEAMLVDVTRLGWLSLAFSLAGMGLFALVAYLTARQIVRPISTLAAISHRIAKGDLDTPIPTRPDGDEIEALTRDFSEMRDSLKEQIRNVEELARARQKLQSELDVARDIQLSMVSPDMQRPGTNGTLLARGMLEPARAVGGDFYSFFMSDETTLMFLVGDVSDKGIPAALFMSRTVALFKTHARTSSEPAHVLELLNADLCEQNDSAMFATAICGKLDVLSGDLLLSSAGHDAPLMMLKGADPGFLALESGPALGFDTPAEFETWRGQLPRGAVLLMYTDGVTEAVDTENQLYGEERVLVSASNSRACGEDLLKHLYESVKKFGEGAEVPDDLTIVTVSLSSE